MGCTNCNKHEGCETEKGPQRTLIDRTLSLVYPGGVWGQPDDEARYSALAAEVRVAAICSSVRWTDLLAPACGVELSKPKTA